MRAFTLLQALCRFAQAALRKMYQVLLGNLGPPEDVTPSFIDEEMSEVGSVQQQQAERRRLFMVSILLQHVLLGR